MAIQSAKATVLRVTRIVGLSISQLYFASISISFRSGLPPQQAQQRRLLGAPVLRPACLEAFTGSTSAAIYGREGKTFRQTFVNAGQLPYFRFRSQIRVGVGKIWRRIRSALPIGNQPGLYEKLTNFLADTYVADAPIDLTGVRACTRVLEGSHEHSVSRDLQPEPGFLCRVPVGVLKASAKVQEGTHCPEIAGGRGGRFGDGSPVFRAPRTTDGGVPFPPWSDYRSVVPNRDKAKGGWSRVVESQLEMTSRCTV